MAIKNKKIFVAPLLSIFLSLLWLAAEYNLIKTTIPIGPFTVLALGLSLVLLIKNIYK
ncbi:MAG: hypothetical protein QXH71_02030 [Candidatus Anstonellaceae archaeon]